MTIPLRNNLSRSEVPNPNPLPTKSIPELSCLPLRIVYPEARTAQTTLRRETGLRLLCDADRRGRHMLCSHAESGDSAAAYLVSGLTRIAFWARVFIVKCDDHDAAAAL